jgi:hypothetical protein
MPDFRAARAPRRDVRHRRRPLRDRIVARDEPGRPEGVAEEAGLEMVIVCGHNMGDIFRRNASTSACTSCRARGGRRRAGRRRVHVRSGHARLTNETQGKTYEPVPLSPKEDEIRRAAASSRSAAASSRVGRRRAPAIDWPDPTARADDDDRADRLGASRRQGSAADVRPGDDAARLRRSAAGVGRHRAVRDPHLQPDHRRQHDLSAAGGDRQRSLRLHRKSDDDDKQTASAASSRGCTASRSRTTRRRATASSTSIFPSRGW